MRKAGLTVELVDSPMRNGYGADKVKLFWVRAPQGPTPVGPHQGQGPDARLISGPGLSKTDSA